MSSAMNLNVSSRELVRELTDAGFLLERRARTGGSHSIYKCGSILISVPDGHKEVSPGVVRKVRKAIVQACDM